jgi:hypothetical protein
LPIEEPQPEESPENKAIRLDFETFGEFLPKEFDEADVSLFTEKELNVLPGFRRGCWFEQMENSLSFICHFSLQLHKTLIYFTIEKHCECYRLLMDAFRKEMAEHRALVEL